MRRGEIRWVDLAPTRGAEASKVRPAVIVSNDGANVTAYTPPSAVLWVRKGDAIGMHVDVAHKRAG